MTRRCKNIAEATIERQIIFNGEMESVRRGSRPLSSWMNRVLMDIITVKVNKWKGRADKLTEKVRVEAQHVKTHTEL